MSNDDLANELGKLLIYQNEKGETKIDAYFSDETVWMAQRNIALLYQTTTQNITMHINNIIIDGELDEISTCKDYLQVQIEGSRQIKRTVKHYNLKMIFAIGYRVRNNIGMHFRNWASSILEEYAKKGFVMNDERLRNPKEFGADYFDELLARIRDIRSSEQMLYAKVRDIFATSIDYDGSSEQAKLFFQTVQNKLHFASHGHTAAELIADRADATKDNMGLTSFKSKKVRKQDIIIAKNYLNNDEIDTFNRIVTMYLDYAEFQAKEHNSMYMIDWENKLNEFLKFNDREILKNAGSITSKLAKERAKKQYKLFDKHRKERNMDEINSQIKQIRKEDD